MDEPKLPQNEPSEQTKEIFNEEKKVFNNDIKIKEFNIKLQKDEDIKNENEEEKIINDDIEMAVNDEMEIEKKDGIIQEENEPPINENSKKEEDNEDKKDKISLIKYPISKIKNIMKLDNEIKLCQKEVYSVIGKLTEIFLQELAQNAYAVCKSCKRKTINLEDINSAIKMNPKMGFINFNSIFYVEELNKSKNKSVSAKKTGKIKEKDEKSEEKKDNLEFISNSNIKKKRGKTNTKEKKSKTKSIKNKTLDSMFGK